MSAYNKKDMVLLQEAYAVRLLKEQINYLTLGDIQRKIPLMCESELNYLSEGLENILEFWGGLKSLGGAAKKGIGAVGSAIGQGVANVGRQVANTASSLGKGAVAAGKQMAQNVGDIYQSGEKTSAMGAASKKAQGLVDELTQLVSKYEPETTQDQIMGLTLQEILDSLAQETETTKANTPGFTQGVGTAASQAYGANRTPSAATPPPLPATA